MVEQTAVHTIPQLIKLPVVGVVRACRKAGLATEATPPPPPLIRTLNRTTNYLTIIAL